jgi:hypothetical protein
MQRCFKRGHVLGVFACLAYGACGGGGGGGSGGTAGAAPVPPGVTAGSGGGNVAAGGAGGAGGAPAGGAGAAGTGGRRGDAGGQPSNDSGVMPVSPEVLQACAAYGSAICAKLMVCSPAELQADYGDMATCAARRALACTAGASAPGSLVKPPMLMACATGLAAGACDAFGTRGIEACVLKGSRGDGDACASDFQCGSGFCKRTRGINCGSCTPLGRADVSPCADSTECGVGLECSGTGVCKTPSAVGGPCSNAQPCKLGAYCRTNVCAAQVEMAGAACQGQDSCSGQKGLICTANRCAAIVFAKPGQMCGGPGVSICEGSGDCNVGQQGNMGVCSMVAADGESCLMGKSCLAPAECLSGICDIPRGTDTGFCN